MFSSSSTLPRGRILALVILGLAIALRVWDINARALWFDEASEYWVATAPLSGLARAVREGSGDPPLYAFLLHAWSRAGDGEIWLRSLSVVFSIAGLAGVMVFARGVAGRAAALAAGIMVALSPADIRYAQEVGQYALMPAAIAWSLVALWRLAHGGRWRWIIAWVTSALAASYAYYGAVFAVMAPFACVVAEAVLARDVRRRRTTGTALFLYLLGVWPLLVYFLPAQLSRVVADTAVVAPDAGGIGAAWRWLSEMLAFQFTGWPYTDVPAAVPVLASLLLVVLAARAHRRVLAWLAASWACYGIADVAGLFPHGYRWGLILFPLLVSMAGIGAAVGGRAYRTSAVAMVALSVLALSSLVSLPHRGVRDRFHHDAAWAWPETEDMRAIVSHWRANRTGTQPTYVYYGAAPAFAYYTRNLAPRADLPPTWHLACWHDAQTPAYCRADGIYYGRWLRRLTPEQRVNSAFETMGERPHAFWLVFSHIQPQDDRDMLAEIVRMGYRIESAAQGRDAAVFLVALP
jgi:hypothetical protein